MRKLIFSVVLCFASLISLIIAGVFAMGAYNEHNNYSNNSVDIIDAAAVSAQADQRSKNIQIIDEAKKGVVIDGRVNPVKFAYFQAPERLANLKFEYPRTWSIFIKNDATAATDNSRFDAFFDIGAVQPTTTSRPHALRLSIVDRSYENTLSDYRARVNSGDLIAIPYVVSGHVTDSDFFGMRLDGIIEDGISGTLIILPLRDKTIMLRNEVAEATTDFEDIVLPSLDFIP